MADPEKFSAASAALRHHAPPILTPSIQVPHRRWFAKQRGKQHVGYPWGYWQYPQDSNGNYGPETHLGPVIKISPTATDYEAIYAQ